MARLLLLSYVLNWLPMMKCKLIKCALALSCLWIALVAGPALGETSQPQVSLTVLNQRNGQGQLGWQSTLHADEKLDRKIKRSLRTVCRILGPTNLSDLSRQAFSGGTGALYSYHPWTGRGLVVTANHVIEAVDDPHQFKFEFNIGRQDDLLGRFRRVVMASPTSALDYAVVEVQLPRFRRLQTVKFSATRPQVNEAVYVVGAYSQGEIWVPADLSQPSNLDDTIETIRYPQTLSVGYVGSSGGIVDYLKGHLSYCAHTYCGSSGGPVLKLDDSDALTSIGIQVETGYTQQGMMLTASDRARAVSAARIVAELWRENPKLAKKLTTQEGR